ncbi:MAG: DUF5597 domain-containing protein, partial [Firmicutes bacterium]|nr:DUF5597 domain-containing protein [Bacillota bacterium]
VECATHSYAASRAIYTIGHYHAMCYSPFGIEDLEKEFNSLQGFLFSMDVDDPSLKIPMDPKEYSDVMFLLNGMIQNLAAAYGTPSLQATCAEQSTDLGYSYLKFNKYTFKTVYHSPFQTRRNGACLILEESDDTFFVLLNGCTISVQGNNREFAEILSLEEGYFENQQWRRLGKLNGDEMQFIMSDAPKLLKIKLHTIKEDVQF